MQQIETHEQRRSRRLGWGIVALSVVFVGCWYLWWFPTWTARMILPNGYRGQVEIVLDETHGTEIPWHWGTYTYRIPPKGVLRVRSLSLFRVDHNESWMFADGAEIPEAWMIDSLPLGDSRRNVGPVLVHAVGGVNSVVTYFVGSFREYHEWEDERSFPSGRIEPATHR